MKKLLFGLLFTFACVNMNAQHISFLGIQLGQSQATIEQSLKQKGFKYVGESIDYTHIFKGAFWIYQNVTLVPRTHKGKVTEIIVSPSDKLYNRKSDFNNLINNLNKKYGNFHSIEKPYSTISYNWYVKGGCIQANCFNRMDGSISITIRYIDYTSIYYVNPQRNDRGNDL